MPRVNCEMLDRENPAPIQCFDPPKQMRINKTLFMQLCEKHIELLRSQGFEVIDA